MKRDAFFVCNELSALGFMDAVLGQKLSIPEVIAIIGFDDIERGEHTAVSVTAIRQQRTLIGKEAMRLLLKLMGQEVQFYLQSQKAGIGYARILRREETRDAGQMIPVPAGTKR